MRVGVPGVAGRAEAARLGDGQDPELGQVGLADDHEARVAQPPHHEGVVAGHEVAEEVGAERVGHARPPAAVSLIAIGTPANGRSSPGPTASAAARAPSASTWTNAFSSPLQRLDPLERGLDQLARGDLAVADQARQLGHGREQRARTRGEPYAGTSSARKAPRRSRASWNPPRRASTSSASAA